MTSVKKVKVALLALVAALVIAIPTSAFADGYEISINNDKEGHTYGAYQVFSGDLSGDTLSNIVWGEGVDDKKVVEGKTLIQAIQASDTRFASATTAAQVAEVLATFDNGQTNTYGDADKFAATVAPYLTTPSGTAGYDDNYTISGLDAGYYLIRDTNVVTGQDAATKFILKVVKDQPGIAPKSSIPASDKAIDEDDDSIEFDKNDGTLNKVGDYRIGQEIPYRLHGTLPDSYANYASYYYAFRDWASEGLDYVVDANNKVIVEVYVKGQTTPVNPDLYTVIMGEPTDKEGFDKGFTVEFADLKQVTTNASDEIYVYYKAVLNSSAKIGNPGNPNESDLVFSNDSNNTGEGSPKGDTPEDYAIAFTYELDNTKTGENNANLAGAKFVLYRAFDADVEDKDFEVAEGEEAPEYMYVQTDAAGKVTGWTDDIDQAKEFVSGDDGRFDVIGLDQGTYWLEETEAPAEYNLLAAPIKVVITATHEFDATKGIEQIKTLQIAVNDGNAEDSADTNKGKVAQTIGNTKGSVLPSTGGIGTTIFTIVGIALIVAAVAIMVVRRRNAAAIQ